VAKLKQKKISRNYRVTHLFDLIVKRGAKILGTSEANFIELCVLNCAEEYIRTRKRVERLSTVTGEDDLSGWVDEAARQLRNRLTK
jgi:hypothetical protein